MLEGSDEIFDVSVVDFIDIIGLMSEMKSQLGRRGAGGYSSFLNGKASEQISTKAAKEEQAEDTAGDSAQTE